MSLDASICIAKFRTCTRPAKFGDSLPLKKDLGSEDSSLLVLSKPLLEEQLKRSRNRNSKVRETSKIVQNIYLLPSHIKVLYPATPPPPSHVQMKATFYLMLLLALAAALMTTTALPAVMEQRDVRFHAFCSDFQKGLNGANEVREKR